MISRQCNISSVVQFGSQLHLMVIHQTRIDHSYRFLLCPQHVKESASTAVAHDKLCIRELFSNCARVLESSEPHTKPFRQFWLRASTLRSRVTLRAGLQGPCTRSLQELQGIPWWLLLIPAPQTEWTPPSQILLSSFPLIFLIQHTLWC